MSRERRLRLGIAAALLLAPGPALAHELWLEPTQGKVAEGGDIVAEVKIGQMLDGLTYSYLPSRAVRFDIVTSDGAVRPIDSIVGDLPAVNENARMTGLTRIVHQTKPDTLFYQTFEKFQAFVEKEGLDGGVARHRERGLPEQDFIETYDRTAKALIAVGDGAGADTPVGLVYELAMETNPFTAPPTAPLWARLLWQGAPRAGAQVSLFRKAPDGAVTHEVLRTDADGRVRVPPAPGFHLLSAVILVEPSEDLAKQENAVWHSTWASVSFHRPSSE